MLKSTSLLLIRLYQKSLSPLLPAACRFYPSCSEYSRESIHRYGFTRGVRLSLLRLCKCHPFHPGGYDPVP
ncbi:membrane protein insertion efficiency factor YidD [Geobacter sp. SVR]|uniref:membrane protein insertion efficiency factor YidD n=1 Tax=Geobacter sp. SVR TaxID=2495594 RepID=UPI00143F050D|nr:membrane protein insertion efficiency factor YidD [Geobacter sp. SVR]BCS56114.1 putative membrane protein insertion efficiency factor [Geobacter sp. SVR]GCF84877.1 putative membrane protein insertion efficiency factor [Geobacter sp. SVR]